MRPFGVGLGLVAVGHLLGQVLGQVADAPGRVLRAGQHALGVEPVPEPGHMHRLVLVPDRVQGLVPGGQDFPGVRIDIRTRLLVPHRPLIPVKADRGYVRPPDLVIGSGQHPAQLGAGHGAADRDVDVRGQALLRFDGGKVLHVIAEEPPEVFDEPVEQGREVQRVPRRPGVVVGAGVGGGAVVADPPVAGAGQGEEHRRPERLAVRGGVGLPDRPARHLAAGRSGAS